MCTDGKLVAVTQQAQPLCMTTSLVNTSIAGSLQEPFLRKLLELHGFALEMNRKDFLALNWAPFLDQAATMAPQYRCVGSMHESRV